MSPRPDRYRAVRRALWAGSAVYGTLGPLAGLLVGAAAHLDPSMTTAGAWAVHLTVALVVAVPSLIAAAAGLGVAAALGPRPDPSAVPWAWALCGVYALGGLWPVALWLAWALRAAAPSAARKLHQGVAPGETQRA